MFKIEINGKTNNKSLDKEGEKMVVLFIFFICALFVASIYFGKIQIEIADFKFSSTNKKLIDEKYLAYIRLKLLGKITVFRLKITSTMIEKIKQKKDFQKKFKDKLELFGFQIIENQDRFDLKILEALKSSNIKIKDFDLEVEIGTENAVLTSMLVAFLGTVFSIVLNGKKFVIHPRFINQNFINFSISGIFEVKMNHIISIIFNFNKKEGVREHERTSDRRPYDYSYE